MANRGLATGVPGVCELEVGVVAAEEDGREEPPDWPTDQVLLLMRLPALWLLPEAMDAADEEMEDADDAELAAETAPEVDDCILDVLVRLASDETFEPRGTLLVTLNRVQSLT